MSESTGVGGGWAGSEDPALAGSIGAHNEWLDDLRIRPGTLADYAALAPYHYRSGRPAAITRVFALERAASTVVGRFLQREGERQVVGVLVRARPRLACGQRTEATGGRYRGLSRAAEARLINREVRTISRVIIDPRYRGLGLAVRLVRHALRHPETLFTEALAAMGRVNPFFERAGMRRYDAPPSPPAQRLLDALAFVRIAPFELASPRTLAERLAARPDQKLFLTRELKRWHRSAFRSKGAAADQLSLNALLDAARTRLLAPPVYYLFRHPEMETDAQCASRLHSSD